MTTTEDLERDGYTILRGALDAAHVAELVSDIERLERELSIPALCARESEPSATPGCG